MEKKNFLTFFREKIFSLYTDARAAARVNDYIYYLLFYYTYYILYYVFKKNFPLHYCNSYITDFFACQGKNACFWKKIILIFITEE